MQQTPYPSAQVPELFPFFDSHSDLDIVNKMMSGGKLLEIWLLDNHLLDTFGSKSTARHEIDQLLESS